MGTLLAIMGGYYLLSGQAAKAAKEIVDRSNKKLNNDK